MPGALLTDLPGFGQLAVIRTRLLEACLLAALGVSQEETSLQVLNARRIGVVFPECDLDVLVHQELLPLVQVRASHVSSPKTECVLKGEGQRTNEWLVPISNAA